MSEYAYENVQVVVKHVPDFSLETGPDGNKVRVELPGKYQVGAVVNGAFVPLAAIGKGRLDRKVEAAGSSGGGEQGSQGEPAPQQTGDGGTSAAPVAGDQEQQ
jgi:hypothetical protein